MRIASKLRFAFGVLVETGRTSSYTSKLYPSTNGQNVDPRFRPCLEAPPGWVICSVDFSSMELCTLADFCYKQFGYSTARDLLIEKVDLHAYLGGQLALDYDPDFHEACLAEYDPSDLRGHYDAFQAMKERDPKWHKHYRTFAKPTGLGYPGGLYPATMIEYAWGTFRISLTLEQAARNRDIWLGAYPEMEEYFEYIREQCADPFHEGVDEITGDPRQRFRYTTPLGLHRCNAAYTSAANGVGLQSYAADAALLAIWDVFDACHNPAANSILYGCKPFDFVHDELLVLMPYDGEEEKATLRAEEISRRMVEQASRVVTEVPVRAEPAFSRAWRKEAEAVYKDGILIPWEDHLSENQ